MSRERDPFLDVLFGTSEAEARTLDEERVARSPVAADLDRELVVDRRTGKARQAGAAPTAGGEADQLLQWRKHFQGSLYAFTKGVLRRRYLSPVLHKGVCRFITRIPPRRKLLMLPREHAKTTIISHGLPLHMIVQDAETNLYFPPALLPASTEPIDGSDVRMYLCGETLGRARDHIRVVRTVLESNQRFRAFWPHRCWDNPRRQAKAWNNEEIIIPRENEFPDPTLRAMGVDGAITGAHPLVLIKDDLISNEAADSAAVMTTAIQWHIDSRALINRDECLEFIIGTHWAVGDLYCYIEAEDPTVEIAKRACIEDGRTIYGPPHGPFTPEKIEQLRREFKSRFPLLYMNSVSDPDLVDFLESDLREFVIENGFIHFTEGERDAVLTHKQEAELRAAGAEPRLPPSPDLRGQRLNGETYKRLVGEGGRADWFRFNGRRPGREEERS